MSNVLIETFLAVVATRSITKAAGALYVSQSTVSSRIKQLEKNIGATMIERRKGIRSVELTPLGVAQRYSLAEKEIEQFQTDDCCYPVTVTGTDSLNTYVLCEFYRELIDHKPPFKLQIKTNHSPEIYRIIDRQEADVGFVYFRSRYANIIAEPVLSETMYVLLSADSTLAPGCVHPSQLDPAEEIFFPWSPEIILWHDKWWHPDVRSNAQIDTPALLRGLLRSPDNWALCPASVARVCRTDPKLQVRVCAESIPERVTYMLLHENRTESVRISLFGSLLKRYLAEYHAALDADLADLSN